MCGPQHDRHARQQRRDAEVDGARVDRLAQPGEQHARLVGDHALGVLGERDGAEAVDDGDRPEPFSQNTR